MALDLEWAMVIDQPEIVGENSDEYDELRDVLYEDREYLIPLYDSYSHIFRFEDPKPQKD